MPFLDITHAINYKVYPIIHIYKYIILTDSILKILTDCQNWFWQMSGIYWKSWLVNEFQITADLNLTTVAVAKYTNNNL